MTLNDKIKNLEPYEPNDSGYKVRLDANESYFNLPENIKDEICEKLRTMDFNRYPDPMAKKVTKAFADFYKVNPEIVTAGNGSDELISVILSAFLKKGEKVLTVSPDFSMYAFYSQIFEDICVSLPKENGLKIDVDKLINTANTENAALIIFSNPCNPTGQGISKQEVRKILKSVDALVVLDEAYMDFWEQEQSLLSEVEDYDNLIILRTASKAVGMASIRLGFAVANKKITKVLKAVKSPYNVNAFSQLAGEILYSHKDFLQNNQKSIVNAKENLYNELKSLGNFEIVDTVTNFLLIKTVKAKLIFEYLLSKSIAVRLMGDMLRITVGSEEENEALISALKAYFDKS
ncbi:MAG: histidinol-phosphate transaminase [Bacillota bacterium]|nr:histidinol-phosphate transaminase [Bacillota bacterium]